MALEVKIGHSYQIDPRLVAIIFGKNHEAYQTVKRNPKRWYRPVANYHGTIHCMSLSKKGTPTGYRYRFPAACFIVDSTIKNLDDLL